ncbi:zinc finger protein 816-like [Anastrepha ludens]|uniref:zinc finger protein 816-like n=1 Tax=Anastrepha ludens TaxID=28586 RepID=UPI0023B14F14|nr:zinc finger protein 816-like [Anastrepha ludens]
MSNASILAELKPCGYILATSQYKYFALKCLYCDKKYGYWATFLQHLKELHMEIADETQWLFESTEEVLESEMENKAMGSEECTTRCVNAGAVTNAHCDSSNVCELYKSVHETEDQNENKFNENKIEGDTQLENIINMKVAELEVVDYPLKDLNSRNENEYDLCPESEILELVIDLNIEDVVTLQFIKIYKNFPSLWPIQHITSNAKNMQCSVKVEMLRSLAEHNILICMRILEESLSQLHHQYCDIARRLEEGIEISDVEEKYFLECSFMKPCNTPQLEQSCLMPETENEDYFSDQSENDKSLSEIFYVESLQSGFDLSDGETNAPQENHKQSLLKFSAQNKVTCNFIKCFRDQPCLWNLQYPAYNDLKERALAISKMKEFFSENYDLYLTEGKINSEIKRLYIFYKRCLYTRRTLNATRKYYYELCEFLANAELDTMNSIHSNSHRKISFSVIDEFTLGFIDFYAMHPVLWDKSHSNYSVLSTRREAYEEIATNLRQIYNVEFSNEELYYAISRLKHHFYNLQRKSFLNEPLKKEEQDFLERCSFLPTSNNNLKCQICDRILRSHSTLKTHLLKVHNIGELPHKCSYCEQRFAQRNLKREHEVRAHTKEFEWFCPFCAKGFANRRDMEIHQMVHTGERKNICEHCGKGFRLKHQMTEHVKIMHERLRRFKCTMCPKDFLRKRVLDDHMRAHLNIRDKICNICGKGFTNIHGLFRHKQLHSDVKRYECKDCGERFRRLSGLCAHKKRKHQTVKQRENSVNMFMEGEEDVTN